MTEQQRKDAINAAREMTAALNGLSGRLETVKEDSESRDKELGRYGRRNRILIWVAVLGLILDITATTIAFLALVGVRHNSATITDLHATSVNACVLGNQTRAQEIALWEHIYSLSHINSHTPAAQRKADNELIAYVRHVFAPRNCPAIYRTR